jgi:hypothetical protein
VVASDRTYKGGFNAGGGLDFRLGNRRLKLFANDPLVTLIGDEQRAHILRFAVHHRRQIRDVLAFFRISNHHECTRFDIHASEHILAAGSTA